MGFMENVEENFRNKINELDNSEAHTREWTRNLLKLLDDISVQVFSASNKRSWRQGNGGEYLLDFTYVQWEEQPLGDSKLVCDPHRVIVACESEWGADGAPKKDFEMVKDDFCKLLDIKSQYKIMIFGYQRNKTDYLASIKEMFVVFFKYRISNCPNDPIATEDWLFVGVPWDGEKGECVFYRKQPGGIELTEIPTPRM